MMIVILRYVCLDFALIMYNFECSTTVSLREKQSTTNYLCHQQCAHTVFTLKNV